ncbi:MAG: hypothetical protein IJ469_06515 [Candidatus Methanomethylophilaceae archaeon]|nr:hypothetical protein [Candidatus Methanomethylophilaceae archaeon]
MNTKEEIIDAMRGESKDLPPPAIFTQTGTVGQMSQCGSAWPDANTDPVKMAELSVQLSKQFGFACSRVPYCLVVESEAFGCDINEGTVEKQPMIVGSPYYSDSIMDVPDMISPEEFVSTGRRSVVLDAAGKIASEHEDLFLTASMMDPLAVSCQVIGMENLLMGLFMECDKIVDWIKALTPRLSAYAKALSEVSDNVMVITEGESDIIPPDMFDMLVTEHTSKVVSETGSTFSTVHCCGNTIDIIENLVSIGSNALSIETHVDPEGILDRIGGKARLVGGIKPVDVLLQGTPEQIVSDAKKHADLGYSIIAPECGVPPRTSDENLMALSKYREL